MSDPLFYIIGSIFVVSLIAFLGIVSLALKENFLRTCLIYLVAFAAGGLLGDSFLHLISETVKEFGFGIEMGLALLAGFIVFFIIEKVVHWHHFHVDTPSMHLHPITYTNIAGDAMHNFIDGIIIAASYLASIPLGIATTIAVIFHEIPQEIGDFGILVHGGYTKNKALLINFLTALTAFLGAGLTILAASYIENLIPLLLPFAAGSFIYIASADLIPELHKEKRVRNSLLQLFAFMLGIGLMYLLLIFG